ncbi:MAG: hypothetical protein WC346_10125 [Methanogenium sp.]|jgi:hypothetical protein
MILKENETIFTESEIKYLIGSKLSVPEAVLKAAIVYRDLKAMEAHLLGTKAAIKFHEYRKNRLEKLLRQIQENGVFDYE